MNSTRNLTCCSCPVKPGYGYDECKQNAQVKNMVMGVMGLARTNYILKHDWPEFDCGVIVFAETGGRHTLISVRVQWCALQPWVTY